MGKENNLNNESKNNEQEESSYLEERLSKDGKKTEGEEVIFEGEFIPKVNIVKQLQESLLPVIEVSNDIRHCLREAVRPVKSMASDFRQSLVTSLALIDFQQIHEALNHLKQNAVRFKAIMLEVGFPPHDSMPVLELSRIVRVYDEKGVEYTKRLIERYMTLFVYHEKILRDMQKTWQGAEWLERRVKILNTAIEGHVNGYYDLTIPTLFSQIEGILVEGMLTLDKTDRKVNYRMQKNFLAQVILGDTDKFSFNEEIEKIYTTIVLAGFERGKPINSELSRHAILHGEDVNYGTKLNSLKTILLFDYLFKKLDELYRDIEKSSLS